MMALAARRPYAMPSSRQSLPGSIWDTILAQVDPSVMPARPITFEVITSEGTASISPTVP